MSVSIKRRDEYLTSNCRHASFVSGNFCTLIVCLPNFFQLARINTSLIVRKENGASDAIYGTPREVLAHMLINTTAVTSTIPHNPATPAVIIKITRSIVIGGYNGEVT